MPTPPSKSLNKMLMPSLVPDPCGTARLSQNIHQGVVDPQLRVHGIKNLRVADASVIPVIPDCRIQNSVYMIGEKVRSPLCKPL